MVHWNTKRTLVHTMGVRYVAVIDCYDWAVFRPNTGGAQESKSDQLIRTNANPAPSAPIYRIFNYLPALNKQCLLPW